VRVNSLGSAILLSAIGASLRVEAVTSVGNLKRLI
jgi:hypothetical protein